MNREIKFRGFCKVRNEWVFGYLVIDPQNIQRIYCKPFDEATSNTYYNVIPESVGQFTGLKDKNGKEIFEGDIINDDGLIMVTEFIEGAFCKCNDIGNWLLHELKCEVIGNIFDNPELLK